MSCKVWAVDCETTLSGLSQSIGKHQQVLQQLTSLLTEQEKLRASKFRQPADSLRFAVGRAAIRSLIIKNSSVSNKDNLFSPVIKNFNSGSKPVLDELSKLSYPEIADFNISHDGNWVLAGISTNGIIGVDIARVYCPAEMTIDQYINEFSFQLSPQEQAYLLAQENRQKLVDFYRIWTVKEAYVKAIGTGIAAENSIDLSAIDVSLSAKSSALASISVKRNAIPLKITLGSLKSGTYIYAIASPPQQAISVDIVQIQDIY